MDWMQEESLLEKAIWMEDFGGWYKIRAEEENMEQTEWKRPLGRAECCQPDHTAGQTSS